MKKRRVMILMAVILCGISAAQDSRAQFTTVTGTVTDANGIPYAGGTMSAILVPASSGGWRLSGQPYSGRVGPATLDSTGTFTAQFGSNAIITPAASQWQITINSNPGGIAPPLGTGSQTFVVTMTISGASQNISVTLTAAAPNLTNFSGAGPTGITGAVTATHLTFATAPNVIGDVSGSAVTAGTGAISFTASADGVTPLTIIQHSGTQSAPLIDVQGEIAAGLISAGITGFYSITDSAVAHKLNMKNPGVMPADAEWDYPITAGSTGNFLVSQGGAGTPMIWSTGCTFTLTGNLNCTNSLSVGTGPTACGAATGCIAFTEGAVAGTPTAGQSFIRATTTHSLVTGVNGVAEVPLAWWSAAPAGGLCVNSLGTLGMIVEVACTSGAALSAITAAVASNTIANGNNPQRWNWAQTTDSQDSITFGETSAATGGTLTSGLANQSVVTVSTATNSTATPIDIVQGSITNTVATPMAQFRTTWNNAGLIGQGFVLNVTDTASASGSVVFNFEKNNVSLLQLRKDGRILTTVPGGDAVLSATANSLRLATESSNQFVQSNVGFAYNTKQTIASSATPAFNLSTGNVFSNTLTANVTGATLNNLRESQAEFFELCQDGTGGRSFVWPTNMKDPPLTHLDASVCRVYPFIYDGTSLFYIGGESAESNVTPVTVNANVATDQLLQAIPIPSNSLNIVGHTLDIWTAGVYTTTAANTSTVTVKAKLCTVSGCGSGIVITLATFTSTANAGGQTNNAFSAQLFSTTQTGGASSVFEAHGNLTVDLTAAVASQVFGDANTAVTSAIDTTGPLFLQITAAFSVASGSNSFTGRQLRARLN